MNKIQSFQALRAIAIFLIFLSHCSFLINVNNINRLNYLGAAGVSLFIALSGFLAAMKYTECPIKSLLLYKIRWKQFWKLHIITLILSIPLSISIFHPSFSLDWFLKLGCNLSLLQALIPIGSFYFSFNSVSWYLSLTLMFALLTPLAIKIWHSLTCEKVIIALIILCLLEGLICVIFRRNQYLHWISYISPFTRFLDFVIGGGYSK